MLHGGGDDDDDDDSWDVVNIYYEIIESRNGGKPRKLLAYSR
jgi:hypothetical protein